MTIENSKVILPINEIYACLQGEGKLMGVPHILIRVTGCRLRCQFANSFCDTPYSSWSPEKGKYGAIDKVMTNLEKQTKKGIKNPHYNPDFKAKGGPVRPINIPWPKKRAKKGHGGSAQSHYLQHGYGPHKIQLRSGKPKLAKKGW